MRLSLLTLLLITILACDTKQDSYSGNQTEYGNPAAQGFNMEDSDSMAVMIADSVMSALGGRQNWDSTQFITWNFFGRRVHTWDKWNGKDRIEFLNSDLLIEFDIETKEGTVMEDGVEVTDEEKKAEQLQRAYEIWVNDSYWLVMPYKLKDSGVTLSYLGLEETETGFMSHKLQLTFESVGVTPQNKYHVYVDTTNYLVRFWKYFPENTMDTPRIATEWSEWTRHGDIMLSGARGQYQLSDIAVLDSWSDN